MTPKRSHNEDSIYQHTSEYLPNVRCKLILKVTRGTRMDALALRARRPRALGLNKTKNLKS